MRKYLYWWTNLGKETKKQIMHENGITKILYADIKRLYLEQK